MQLASHLQTTSTGVWAHKVPGSGLQASMPSSSPPLIRTALHALHLLPQRLRVEKLPMAMISPGTCTEHDGNVTGSSAAM